MTDSEKGEAVENMRQTVAPEELSNREIARRLGVDEISIRRWRKAAGYPEEVKQMIKSQELTDYAVSPIADLDTTQEQIKTAEYIRDNGLNYRQAKDTVEVIKELPEQPIVNTKEQSQETFDQFIEDNRDNIYQVIESPPVTTTIDESKELEDE
ncbi:hypothetical protein [Sporomusa aerivorans]|uniref:hypothetical protein n=1 Tax=Sporomusa aerivorans TaxID=204936 RepID=UPI00352A478F